MEYFYPGGLQRYGTLAPYMNFLFLSDEFLLVHMHTLFLPSGRRGDCLTYCDDQFFLIFGRFVFTQFVEGFHRTAVVLVAQRVFGYKILHLKQNGVNSQLES